MKELIEQHAGLSVWVQGVVAVWGELVGGLQKRDKVLYVRDDRLAEALGGRPRRLADEQRALVAATLDSLEAGLLEPARVQTSPNSITAQNGQ
jgi:hypothetical protein